MMRKSVGSSAVWTTILVVVGALFFWMLFGPDSTSGGSGAATGSGCKQSHTVVAGDDLSHLASRYGTSIGALANANGITNPNLIFAGQELCVDP